MTTWLTRSVLLLLLALAAPALPAAAADTLYDRLGGQPAGVERARSAEGHQGVVGGVVAALDQDDPNGARHVRGDDDDDPLRGLERSHPEPLAQALSRIASFDQNPAKPMPATPTPVIARVPMTITQKVIGISRRSAP